MNSYGMAEAVAAVSAAPVTPQNIVYIPKNLPPNQLVTFLSPSDPFSRGCCSVGGVSLNISSDFEASRVLVVDVDSLAVVEEGIVGEIWFASEWLGKVCFCGWCLCLFICVLCVEEFYILFVSEFLFFIFLLFRDIMAGKPKKVTLNLLFPLKEKEKKKERRTREGNICEQEIEGLFGMERFMLLGGINQH